MPELLSLEDEFENDSRVQFISVDTEARSAATARKQLESHGIRPNRLFVDADGWFNRLQIESWPTKLLIRDGKVLRVASGAFPRGNADRWREEIRAFLKAR
jgi:protein-disulfide isomerase-like protein with CxxC motif